MLGVTWLEAEADKGYFNLAQLAQCEADGSPPLCRSPTARRGNAGAAPASEWPASPAAWRSYPALRRDGGGLPACPQRGRCITAKAPCREIWRHEHEALRQRMADRPDAMRHRSATVEHPFGTLKCRAGWNHFLVRGLAKVRGEWSLMAYNFTRVLAIRGHHALAPGQAPSLAT